MRGRQKEYFTARAMLAFVLLILFVGCLGRSPQVRHFMLGISEPSSSNALSPELAVLVGPVRLPAYLQRPQMARRESDGEIELDEFNRWLGGFEENLLRALSLGIAEELGSERVVVHPSKAPFAIDYQVRLHVDDMILADGDGLRVRVRWSLIPLRAEGSPGLFVMDELIPTGGASREKLVEAHEVALMDLVQRIANELVARKPES
jgi:uncharacterized lipoprotein YmbA